MLRRCLAIILTFALLFSSVLTLPSSTAQRTEEAYTTNEGKNVISMTEVDGSAVKCMYEDNTDSYYLYLDDTKYDLNVDIYDGCAMVYISNTNHLTDIQDFTAQSATAFALTTAYWSPKIVAAAKMVIACVIKVTLAVAAYYSAELIATTIYDVKVGEITKRDLKTKTITATKAVDLVKNAKKDNNVYYYEAYLYNGMVMVGKQISFSTAVERLRKGYDVFASNLRAAIGAAKKASTTGFAKFDAAHEGEGIMFPHYHPIGRKWVRDTRHMPHCWFPPKV